MPPRLGSGSLRACGTCGSLLSVGDVGALLWQVGARCRITDPSSHSYWAVVGSATLARTVLVKQVVSAIVHILWVLECPVRWPVGLALRVSLRWVALGW